MSLGTSGMRSSLVLFVTLAIAGGVGAGCSKEPVTVTAPGVTSGGNLPARAQGPQRAYVAPEGVDVAPRDRMKDNVGGLYQGETDPDPSCCWLVQNARLLLKKRSAAKQVVMTFYEPDVSAFRNSPQQVTLVFSNGVQESQCCFRAGLHKVNFAVPANYQRFIGDLDVSLRMRTAFVPAQAHINDDMRHLSVILRRVEFF